MGWILETSRIAAKCEVRRATRRVTSVRIERELLDKAHVQRWNLSAIFEAFLRGLIKRDVKMKDEFILERDVGVRKMKESKESKFKRIMRKVLKER